MAGEVNLGSRVVKRWWGESRHDCTSMGLEREDTSTRMV